MKIKLSLLFALCLVSSLPVHGAPNMVTTCVITVTNSPTGQHGESIAVNGSTYTWTNASPIIGQLASTNTPANSATNLYNQLSRDLGSTLRFSYASASSVRITTFLNGNLSVVLSGNWATNIFSTNAPAGAGLSASNVIAQKFTLNGVMITNWSQVLGTNTINIKVYRALFSSGNQVDTGPSIVVLQDDIGISMVNVDGQKFKFVSTNAFPTDKTFATFLPQNSFDGGTKSDGIIFWKDVNTIQIQMSDIDLLNRAPVEILVYP